MTIIILYNIFWAYAFDVPFGSILLFVKMLFESKLSRQAQQCGTCFLKI